MSRPCLYWMFVLRRWRWTQFSLRALLAFVCVSATILAGYRRADFFVTRRYEVYDIAETSGDLEAMTELIQQTIAQNSWTSVGGPGRIEYSEDGYVLRVYQRRRVQMNIEGLLQRIRCQGLDEV